MNLIQGIKGFLGTSLIDYPQKIAAVIFLGGCNLRCPFCQNGMLLQEDELLEDLRLDEVLGAIDRRKKLIEGVVITGGEPTTHSQLTYLLRHLRNTGLSIKLDTNGLRSTILKVLLKEKLVDYIAMDVKTAPNRYVSELGAPQDAVERLQETVELLRSFPEIEYEFRTTCVPGLVREDDLQVILDLIAGAPNYYLQQYIPTHAVDPDLAQRPAYPREVLERFRDLAKTRVKNVGIRNLR